MAGDDLVKDGAGASATDVFGTVPKEGIGEQPARVAPAVPVAPSSASAASVSSAGFTQLLRALNYDAVKEVPAADVKRPEPISAPAPEMEPIKKPTVPASSSQVTSFSPLSAPISPPVAAAPAPVAGSFTQLFRKLEAEPAAESMPEKQTEDEAPSFPRAVAVPGLAAEASRAEPVSAAPASFTQLFAGMEASAEREIESAPLTDSAITAEATSAPAVRKEAATAAAAVSSPGSFTQMFQALDAPVAETVGHEAQPVVKNAVTPAQATSAVASQPLRGAVEPDLPAPPASAPGSFTQMFQALGTPAAAAAADEARYVAAPVTEAPKQAAPTPPGSFTQMFQTLREEKPPTEQAPVDAPGSFTRLFGSAGPASTPSVPPPSTYERPSMANAPEREPSGASQMFAIHREPQQPADRQMAFSPVETTPTSGSTISPPPSSGGLTQLLRALDGPSSAPKPYVVPSYAPPMTPSPQPGSFTDVYGELGASSAPVSPPAPTLPLAASQTAAATGPSEFTRLIHASALREAALHGGGEIAAPTPESSAPVAGGGFAVPGGLPAVPKTPLPLPGAPQASVAGPGGVQASVSAAGGQASFAAPKLPAVPQAKMPETPKDAGTPAGIQKYVPLLLILVIFLLLAVLVAVVVLMKK